MNELKEWNLGDSILATCFVKQAKEKFGRNIKFDVTFKNGNSNVFRLFANSGNVCAYQYRSSKYGYQLNDIKKISAILPKTVNEVEKFDKNMQRIINLLKVDNLWEDELMQVKFFKAMGYDLCKECYRYSFGRSYDLRTIEQAKEYYDTLQVLYDKILDKVNNSSDEQVKFYFKTRTNHKEILEEKHVNMYSNRDILKNFIGRKTHMEILCVFRAFEYLEKPIIKKMVFHKNKCNKNITENVLNTIATNIDNKTNYHTPRLYNGYDVSFEYNAELNKAWYSEEFKNCGNGHYYIALNRTHALFIEND